MDKKNVRFASLAEILSTSRSQNSRLTNSNNSNTLLPSLEDLQKKLEGNKESCSQKLNFSRAFGLSSLDSNHEDYEDKPIIVPQPQSTLPSTNELNHHQSDEKTSLNVNAVRLNRTNRLENKIKIKREFLNTPTQNTEPFIYNDEEIKEIIRIIRQIETNKSLNFNDTDDKQPQNINSISDFNLIQLPNDFKLENGQLNVYQSGIIEIVTNDYPPVTWRMKRAVHNNGNLTTDLVIATDSQVYINRMNLCIPHHWNNEIKKT